MQKLLEENRETVRRVVTFYDRLASDYDRDYERLSPAGFALRTRRRKVLELFDRAGGRVLDVGCGPGVLVAALLDRECEVWGVDPSDNMLAIARDRFGADPRVHLLQGQATHLQFADGVFDAVLCLGVMDSIPDGACAIAEMTRVLKPGGTLIVTVANLVSPYAWWKNYVYYPGIRWSHRLRAWIGDPTMTPDRIRSCPLRRLYSRAGARRLLESSGLQVTVVVPYFFNLFLSPLDELLPRTALRVLERLEDARGSRPDWFAAGWILKAVKP